MAVYVVGSDIRAAPLPKKTLTDLVTEMRDRGHDITEIPHFDKYCRHRMMDSRRGDLSGWVIVSYIGSDKICATYGDWKTEAQSNWFSDSESFTEKDRSDFRDRIDKLHAEQEIAAQKQEKEAVLFLGNCNPEALDHPYVTLKRITPYLAKRSGRELIIPMADMQSREIKSYQRIWIDEQAIVQKRFKGRAGGRACILLGAANQYPIICEGYATACTIHEATGATVYAAMSTSNIPRVAEILHANGETAILCPDIFDHRGAGVKAAVLAQTGKGWPIFKPPIGDDESDGCGDYNDIGVDRTREYLSEKIGGWLQSIEANQATEKPIEESAHPPEIHIIDDVDYESPETSQDNWIEDESGVEGIIPKEGIGMLFGPSGSGKSFLACDIGLSIATGKKWHDYDAKQGNVLYIIGEGRIGFLNRIKSWLRFYKIKGETIRRSFRLTKHRIALNDPASVALLRADLINLDYTPDIIFIDTLAANMDGNENDTQDAQKFITQLTMLMVDHHIKNICLIHHTGKGDQYSARGSSVFRASADYAIRIDIKKNLETGRISERDMMPEKIKDGREWAPIYFELIENDLGERTNWFGKPVHIIVPIVQIIDKPLEVDLPDVDPEKEEARKAITGKKLLIEIVIRIMDAHGIDPNGRIEYSPIIRAAITKDYRERNAGVGEAKYITKMLTRANLLIEFKESKWLIHPIRSKPADSQIAG